MPRLKIMGDVMTEKEAIYKRHSVRQFKDTPIRDSDKEKLESLIGEINKESGLSIQLITDDPECFNVFLAHYGNFKNAVNYVALVGKKDATLDEKCGYYGQKIVLNAQIMGLNTCFVAGTYSKGKCKAKIEEGEKLVCIIAIGYGENDGAERRTKPIEKICDVSPLNMPEWFKEGLKAAQKAPTAINQQKFMISLKDDVPIITAKRSPMANIDLGIVKYNFEVASDHKCK